MSGRRPIVLNAFLKAAGEYPAGWRHPDSPPAAGTDLGHIAGMVRRLERAGFDALFLPDLVGLPDARPEVLERVAVVNDALEPTTLLAALAAVTERIGLLGTVSTSYSEPRVTARVLASLDRVSGGRAGWNVVTSLNDAEARNFGLDAHLGHAERYARAEAFVDEVVALWSGGEAQTGVPAPVQGRPLIAQAGSSGPGRALAARIADIVGTRSQPVEQAAAFAADLRERVAATGRDPGQTLILPELAAVVAPTRAEAEDRFARVRETLHPRVALADVEYWLGGVELGGLPPESPLPVLPPSNGSVGTQREIYEQAQRDGLSIGDLARLVADGDGAVVGTASDVADRIEELVDSGAADGVNVSFPWLPETLDSFTDAVVPELRRRGLLREAAPAGAGPVTLRERLGLPMPPPPLPARRG